MQKIVRQATVKDAAQLIEIYRPAIEESNTSFELKIPGVDEFAKRIESSLVRHEWLAITKNLRPDLFRSFGW